VGSKSVRGAEWRGKLGGSGEARKVASDLPAGRRVASKKEKGEQRRFPKWDGWKPHPPYFLEVWERKGLEVQDRVSVANAGVINRLFSALAEVACKCGFCGSCWRSVL